MLIDREARRKYLKEYYLLHREKLLLYQKNNTDKNKKRVYDKIYREKNRDKINNRLKIKKNLNPTFKIITSQRSKIGRILSNKKYYKDKSTIDYLGCSAIELKRYLESKFTPEMNWKNYGKYPDGWDVDHIIPLSSAKNEVDFKKLFHYTNLQPLNSYINRHIKREKL